MIRPSGESAEPFEIDRSVAHAARVYDYLLGGTHNFEVDRRVAENANADMPGGIDGARANVRANRRFLGRTVEYLANRGVKQFLDIGTGIPNDDNVHAVAQRTAPASRVVCVDNDPIVLAQAHKLLRPPPAGAAAFVYGDLRRPEEILAMAAETLDFDEPIAVMLVAILHFFPDEDDPYGIVCGLMEALCPGSYLVLSHGAADIDAENMALLTKRLSEGSQETFVWRPWPEVVRFLDGLDIVEPGVVPVDEWRPDATASGVDWRIPFYGAVGRKP
jgi:hypothetical protein